MHELDRLYLEHVADLERRVGGILTAEGWDAVAIHSGSLLKRSRFDDQFWPFRGCPHFQYWLPLAQPECLLLVRAAGGRPTLLRPPAASFWERPSPPESVAFAEVLDVVAARDAGSNRRVVAEHGGQGRVGFGGEDPTRAQDWEIAPDAACPPSLVAALDALRTTKTAYEVACVAEANRRARAGHDALREAFRSGDASEFDLHLLFLRATAQDDAETPYKNIVALGANAATLHHISYGRQPHDRAAESLLVDAGASCRGYGSDVTRTWVKGRGEAVDVFAHLVAGVDEMQQRLCSALAVGTPFEALHDESHRQVGEILRGSGLLHVSADEAVAAGVTRAFFPHGLGHSLGLQTHDVGCGLRAARMDNAFLRNTSDAAAGQVVTIEPGIYFIEALLAEVRGSERKRCMVDWKLVDALAPFGGVRIEDDVLVRDQGVRNLTREEMPTGGGLIE